MNKLITFGLLAGTMLTGCAFTTPEERMAKCQAEGISKDACYIVEKNRQIAAQQDLQDSLLRAADYWGKERQRQQQRDVQKLLRKADDALHK